MAKTVKIDVIDKSIADENNRNIPIINQKNPCYGYDATAKEVAQLIQLSSYYVYAAGTSNIIDGYSFYKYFPEEAGSSGGGGSSGDITKTEIQEMIDASLPKIDSAMSTTSKNPVQNNTITEFVNSSIASNTANYVGQFASVDELNAYSGTLTNNDYAFVINTDEDGNTKYDRYKWNMKEWLFEYTLNNSSFTAEQWASIQSGIKASDVEQITTNKNDITLIKTTKLDASNAVGRNVTGTKYNIDGTDYTAQTGAEIFNNYSNINSINKAVGKYSHAEGYLTVAKGDNSHAEGAASHAFGNQSHAEGEMTTASGGPSHAEGWQSISSGYCSHAEGWRSESSGGYSHAEGWCANAIGNYSHAEGENTKASSSNQHVQGKYNVEDTIGKYAFIIGNGENESKRSNALAVDWNGKVYINNATNGIDLSTDLVGKKVTTGSEVTIRGTKYTTKPGAEIFNNSEANYAVGAYSHAEGVATNAIGDNAHAEGTGTFVSGANAHGEGAGTTASGAQSHTEGASTTASGSNAHAEGASTIAGGECSHAEGYQTKASSDYQHTQGKFNTEDADDKYAFIIGNGTSDTARSNAFAVDWNGKIYVNNATDGVDVSTFKSGIGKDVTGVDFTVGDTTYTARSNAEIFNDYTNNKAVGMFAHAEGSDNIASGNCSHAEGTLTQAIRDSSHTEGTLTVASGMMSHAEGDETKASGNGSHAEGQRTTASGDGSHAEGQRTTASGFISHAEGNETIASGNNSHAEGNGTKASSANQHVQGKYNIEDTEGKYAFIIGNGTDEVSSNAFAVDWNGKIYVNNATEGVDVSKLSSGGSSSITLDDSISETSENAVKNKVISAELDTIRQSIPLSVSKLTNDSNYQTKENLDDALTSYAKTTDIPIVPSNVSSFTNDKQYQTKTDIDTTLATYAKTADLKTKLSEFENDEEYIKNTVDNLVNYYKKIELYTKNEVDTLIGNINKLTSEIVTELPTTDISTSTIYLIKKTDSNAYTQYMYINSAWAELGDTTVDLSNYYSKSEVDDKLSTYATSDTVTTHTSDNTIHVTSDEKTSWNNATAKVHEHDNKTVIDKFSELDGTVLYDGKQIASGNIWNGTKAEYDAIAVKDAETTYVVTDEDDSISGALIDDSSTSTSKTWSAKKISKMISDVIKIHEVISDEYSLQPNSMGKVSINFNLPDNAVVIGIIKVDVVYGGDGNISINVLSPDLVQLYNPTSSAITYKVKMMVSYMLT